MSGLEMNKVDDAVVALKSIRNTVCDADQHWLFGPVTKAINATEAINAAYLEKKASEQTEDEASETPKNNRQRRGNGAQLEPSNSPQSNRVLAP